MTTNAYAAKRALFDRLAQIAGVGRPLANVQVAYSWPGSTVGMECVYGGGVTFEQPGDGDAVDGRRRLVKEQAQVSVHIRVVHSPATADDVRNTDERAEAIGEVIGAELATDPSLAGGRSVTRIVGGQGDYSNNGDQAVSILSYRVTVESYLDPLEL